MNVFGLIAYIVGAVLLGLILFFPLQEERSVFWAIIAILTVGMPLALWMDRKSQISNARQLAYGDVIDELEDWERRSFERKTLSETRDRILAAVESEDARKEVEKLFTIAWLNTRS